MAGTNDDSESDLELARAIALSLAEDNSNAGNQVIELSSDESDDDGDLARAIALSLKQPCSATKSNATKASSDEDDDDDLNRTPKYRPRKETEAEGKGSRSEVPNEPSDLPQTRVVLPLQSSETPGLHTWDRKADEEARLARLAAKRKALDSKQESQGRESKSRTRQTSQSVRDTQIRATQCPKLKRLWCPRGVVKKTFVQGLPRTDDDISIDEIFQKDELELAVLSSFQWDERWMFTKIDPKKTQVCLVAFANSEKQQEEMRQNGRDFGVAIKFCFPKMNGIGSMHSKLQLLKFANHLRVVVPTGNLVPYDWGETGAFMENMVFIIDLPLIKDPERRAANVLTPFGEELAFFLECQGLESTLIKSLGKYDFSATRRYAFVHTIGTSRTGDDWKRTGYCGLGRAVSALGLKSTGSIEVDYVSASLGSVNNDLITAIYYAAQGDDGLKEYSQRAERGKKAKTTSAEDALGQINNHFRIYFPSRQTVDESRGGREAAGTICAQSKWYDSESFPRQLVHESKSARTGLLMHTKLILVRSESTCRSPVAWAYIGSANLSESAWGRLTKDKKTGNPKLTCRNWECGVLVSTAGVDDDDSDSRGSASEKPLNDLSVFLGRIPVPIKWPSEAYGRTGTKRPWLFLENYR